MAFYQYITKEQMAFSFSIFHQGDDGINKPQYLCPSVVYKLHRPPSFILDPDKDASFHIAGGQLLEGFVPSHQDNLQTSRAVSRFAKTYQLALHKVKIMLFSGVRHAALAETYLNHYLASYSKTRCFLLSFLKVYHTAPKFPVISIQS